MIFLAAMLMCGGLNLFSFIEPGTEAGTNGGVSLWPAKALAEELMAADQWLFQAEEELYTEPEVFTPVIPDEFSWNPFEETVYQELPYDPQPETTEEVQAAIDAYEQLYQAMRTECGILAALEVDKPRWQFSVPDHLMPEGYVCVAVLGDEKFSEIYFSFLEMDIMPPEVPSIPVATAEPMETEAPPSEAMEDPMQPQATPMTTAEPMVPPWPPSETEEPMDHPTPAATADFQAPPDMAEDSLETQPPSIETDKLPAIVLFDPQPQSMEEVEDAINAYDETCCVLVAVLEVPTEARKPRWQNEVAAEWMPEGYSCVLVEQDANFNAAYYTFLSTNPVIGCFIYDPQPQALADVQAAIDAYEAAYLEALQEDDSGEAAQAVEKACWQYEVAQELMPNGYICVLAECAMCDCHDPYYTFFTVEEEQTSEEPTSEDETSEADVLDEESLIFDPQPATMEEVQLAIDAYEAMYLAALETGGYEAARRIDKAYWQYEVAAELMPGGYVCTQMEADERFSVAYYTFLATEEGGVNYDTQPRTMLEVQLAIDVYEEAFRKALESGGFVEVARSVVKPHWQYEVAEDLMPKGYFCGMVEDDERFGAAYYTFFNTDEDPAEDVVYDPQPQTMEEVQAAIDAYEEAIQKALETEEPAWAGPMVAKPHWQEKVARELMPEGYVCLLVEDDEYFNAPYYTFFTTEGRDVHYDPQPASLEETQAAIDTYEAAYLEALETGGFEAALEVRKPHWEFEVTEEFMPLDYSCQLVENDVDFGADYYTFFPARSPRYGKSMYPVKPPSSNIDISNEFIIIGDGVRDPDYRNVARITLDDFDQAGVMWSKNKIDITKSFSTKMYLFLDHSQRPANSDPVADGITFTIHNDSRGTAAIGGQGEGLSIYRGRNSEDDSLIGRNIENALVIEFDTHYNDGSSKGPVTDPLTNSGESMPHCSMVIPKRGGAADGSADKITVADHQNTYFFEVQTKWYQFDMYWQPVRQPNGTLSAMLTYIFDGVKETYYVPNVADIFGDTKEVIWGFSGSTGGRTSLQAAAIMDLPYIQPDTYDFNFVKVDAWDPSLTLSGAEFSLYICENKNPGHIHDALATAGSCWFSGTVLHQTSGADGRVAFSELLAGENRLIETAAPAGYQLPEGQWGVVVGESGEINFLTLPGPNPPSFYNAGTPETPDYKYKLPNMRRLSMPLTGRRDALLSMTLGTLMMAGGAAWFFSFCRRKPDEPEE